MTLNSLRLFGSFQLVYEGKPIVLDQPRLEEFVALLAMHPGESIKRIEIAHLLWADSSEKQARANVRNLLYKLKGLWLEMDLEMDNVIDVERTHVSWRRDAGMPVDVSQFQSRVADAGRDDDFDGRIKQLTAAVELYLGDFLSTCFSDWALAERERLRGEYAMALEQLVDALLEQRSYDKALQRAKALQRFDPLSESAYRRLIQAYAALGDRAAALRVYHTCASTLQKELGVEPSPATAALQTQLLRVEEQAAGANAPKIVQRRRLVGRRDEWRQLQDAWRRAQQGEARCVLLWGEAGIGKTRLAEELIDWMQRHALPWASSRSYAVEGALTYAPIAEWLRSPSIRPSLERIDDLWRVELSRLLPGLLADRPDLPSPGPMTESWQQQRFFQSIVRALQAAPAPLLLHLDDMQWSDAETLTLLQFLLHGARSHPLLLIGGIRTEDAGGNQALAAFVEATRHAGQLVEVRLGPLSEQETAELAAQTSNSDIGHDVVETLYATSEGHPLYLIEAVRSGLAMPQDRRDAAPTNLSGIHGITAMPSRIYSLLSGRLGQLSEPAQQVASMAAVIGRAFDYETLHAAVSMGEMALIDALDELWSRHIIREQAGDSYDFSHDRIREVAYQEISRARRRLYHRQVATALEAIHSGNLDAVAGELAAHFALAGDPPAAYRYYRRAANIALAQYGLQDAERLLDQALVHVSEDPIERIGVLHEQNIVFRYALQSGRWRENLDVMQALLSSVEQPPLRTRLVYLMDRSRYFDILGYGQQGVESAKAAVIVAEELNDLQAIAHAHDILASTYWKAGMMNKANQAFERALQHARVIGDRILEGRTLSARVRNGIFTDMPSTQIHDLLTRVFDIAVATDNKDLMIDSLGKLGYWRISVGLGDFDLAEQDLRRAISLGEEIGKAPDIVLRFGNLGWLFANKGDYRQALTALDFSQSAAQEGATYFVHWVNVGRRGNAWMEMGCLDTASVLFREASEMLTHHGARHYEAQVRCDIGWLHLLSNRPQEAQSVLSAVLDFAEESGDLRLKALTCTRLGYVLESCGQLEEAFEKYDTGCDLHHRVEQHYYAMHARAGLARIAALQGDSDVALDHVATIWETIGGKEMDATIETARTLRTCCTIFKNHGDPRSHEVLAMACDQLQRRASSIDDPAHVEQFWQIEDHRFFRRLDGPD